MTLRTNEIHSHCVLSVERCVTFAKKPPHWAPPEPSERCARWSKRSELFSPSSASKGLFDRSAGEGGLAHLLPTPGATDGLLDRLPASLRVSAQASASSSGASRLWSRRVRCLTTWTSRSRAAPERADHLWCAPLSCPSEHGCTPACTCVSRWSGRTHMHLTPANADVRASQAGPAIWELASVDEFEALPSRTGAAHQSS